MAKKKKSKRAQQTRTRRVLLFGGGGHDFRNVCPILKRYINKLPGIAVDYVEEDYDALLSDRLKPYHCIVMYHTGGRLTVEQKRGLVEGVAAGKGFVGVHAAADSFHDSPEYVAMVGGQFRKHPFVRPYRVSLEDNKHPVTKNIQGYAAKHWEPWPVYEYEVVDEQYLLAVDANVDVLATTVFRNRLWPVAWTRPWGKGKVFYLALGHNVAAVKYPIFKELLLGGVAWAASSRKYPKQPDAQYAIS